MKEPGTQLRAVKKGTGQIKSTSFAAISDGMRDTFESIARRAYEIFESNGRQPGRDADNWFRAESEFLHSMNLEVREANGSLRVRAEVPGFDAKELEISVEPTRLTIAGKRESTEEEKKDNVVYSECRGHRLFRSVTLPVEVNAEKTTATLSKGVLELKLPKAGGSRKARFAAKSA